MKYPARCNHIARAETSFDTAWISAALAESTELLEISARMCDGDASADELCGDHADASIARADAAFIREELARRERQPEPWRVDRIADDPDWTPNEETR